MPIIFFMHSFADWRSNTFKTKNYITVLVTPTIWRSIHVATSFISLYQTSLLSAIHTIILANYHQYKRTQKADGQHLLFPYLESSIHKIPRRCSHEKSNLDLNRAATIQRQVPNQYHHPTSHHRVAHKRTIQMIPTLRFSGVGISNNFLPGSCSYATI